MRQRLNQQILSRAMDSESDVNIKTILNNQNLEINKRINKMIKILEMKVHQASIVFGGPNVQKDPD
jgi:hypothetical protein